MAPVPKRIGLTVPHEWWASAPLLKSFEAAGFRLAQVDAPPVSVLRDRRLCGRHAQALAATLQTSGLDAVLHAPPGLRVGEREGDRAMLGLLHYASECNAGLIVYHALAWPDEPGADERQALETKSLAGLARRAEELGLLIAVENLAPLYPGPETVSANPMALRALVRSIGSRALGICLDLGHAHIAAELRHTSLTHLVEPALDQVILFHAHDNHGARHHRAASRDQGIDPLRLDLHLPPGRGNLAWDEAAELVGSRSVAPVICEVHPPYRPRAAELRSAAVRLLAGGGRRVHASTPA